MIGGWVEQYGKDLGMYLGKGHTGSYDKQKRLINLGESKCLIFNFHHNYNFFDAVLLSATFLKKTFWLFEL